MQRNTRVNAFLFSSARFSTQRFENPQHEALFLREKIELFKNAIKIMQRLLDFENTLGVIPSNLLEPNEQLITKKLLCQLALTELTKLLQINIDPFSYRPLESIKNNFHISQSDVFALWTELQILRVQESSTVQPLVNVLEEIKTHLADQLRVVERELPSNNNRSTVDMRSRL